MLYPAQWLQPVEWVTREQGTSSPWDARPRPRRRACADGSATAVAGHLVGHLAQENEALQTAGPCAAPGGPSLAAQILYETADPTPRRVMAGPGGRMPVCSQALSRADVGGAWARSRGSIRCERGHAGHRPGPGHPGSMHPHRVRGGVWRSRSPATAAVRSMGCALSRPMPMYRKTMCWTTMASMAYLSGLPVARVVRVVERRRTRRLRASMCAGCRHPGRAPCAGAAEALRLPSAQSLAVEGTPCSQEGA